MSELVIDFDFQNPSHLYIQFMKWNLFSFNWNGKFCNCIRSSSINSNWIFILKWKLKRPIHVYICPLNVVCFENWFLVFVETKIHLHVACSLIDLGIVLIYLENIETLLVCVFWLSRQSHDLEEDENYETDWNEMNEKKKKKIWNL